MVKNQPQAVTLANPFRIPLHRKGKVKKIRLKDSVCIGDIREFFDLRSVAEGSQNDLLQVEFRILSYSRFAAIKS